VCRGADSAVGAAALVSNSPSKLIAPFNVKKVNSMPTKFFLMICLMLCALAAPLTAHSSDIIFERSEKEFSVQKDGTFTQTSIVLVRLVTENGAKGMGQVPIAFSESLQSLEVLEAYTLKPDGTRLDVKPEAIFTQAAPVAVSAPMFNDIKYRIIVFPEPLMGGKIFFRVRIKQHTPFFPNHFSTLESLGTGFIQEHTEVRLSAPSDFKLNVDVRGYEGGEVGERDGRKSWKWTFKNAEARKPEPFEVSELDFGPYVAVSSFTDWAELGKAYLARAEPKAARSNAVIKLAEEITKGAKDKRDEVRLIYDWSKRNVRYVAVFLGLGGFVPRDVSQIIETKYGDCKDYTTLMVALLRARGIEATTALISLNNSFRLPAVPAVGAFNHAVVYVPQFDLYLDGTSQFSRFDVLPAGLNGKPTLIAGLGKLAIAPSRTVAQETSVNIVKLTADKEGNVRGTTVARTTGNFETVLRAWVANIPKGQEEKTASNWISGAGSKATAKLKVGDPRDFSKPYEFAVEFEIKEAISLDSPGAFRIPTGITSAALSELIKGVNQLGPRKNPFLCVSASLVEEIEMVLPAEVAVAALPKPLQFKSKTVRYESSYKLEGNVISVKRTLLRDRPTSVCSPELWSETDEMRAAIARDLRAQILLK
jgi:hypothetical protein